MLPDLFTHAEERETREIREKRTPVALTPRQSRISEWFARARADLAIELGRPERNASKSKIERNFENHRAGMFAEYAAHKLTGLSWEPVRFRHIDRENPDLGDFVEVKCRMRGTHMLIDREIQINPHYAYLQGYCGTIDCDRAMREGWTVNFAGWMWGADILNGYPVTDKRNTGRPGRWVPEADLRPVAELLDIIRRPGWIYSGG
jgi:hypothetical protein